MTRRRFSLVVRRSSRSLALVALLTSGCSTSVPADNPYDPGGTGTRAPGRIAGTLAVEGLTTQEGLTVRFLDEATSVADTQVSDVNGHFVSAEIAPGAYAVVVEVPADNEPLTRAGVVVLPGVTTQLGTLASALAPATGVIAGAVRLEASSDSPAGVRVLASRTKPGGSIETWSQYTGNDGAYAFTAMPVGTYTVRADRERFTPDLAEATVEAPTAASLRAGVFAATAPVRDLVLYPASAVVRFSVVTADGRVDGAPYANTRDVDLLLLAFGGVNQMRISEQPDFMEGGVEVAWRDHVAEVPVTLGAGEGEKTIYAQFRLLDATVGERLRTEVYAAGIVFDETPPTITSLVFAPDAVDAAGTRWLRGDTTSVPLALTAFDALSRVRGFKVVLDGQDPASVPYADLTTPGALFDHRSTVSLDSGDGARSVRVQLVDAAGNETGLVTSTVTVDNTAPTPLALPALFVEGEDRSGPSSTWTRTAAVTVSVGAWVEAGELASMQVADNAAFSGAAWEPCASSFSWSLPAGDGVKEVWLRVQDLAGNVSDPVTASIGLDQSPPSLGLQLTGTVRGGATSSSLTGTSAAQLHLAAADGALGSGDLELLVTGDLTDAFAGTWIPAVASRAVTLTAASPSTGQAKTVSLVARDRAGNLSATASATILLDTAYDWAAGAGQAIRLHPSANGASEAAYVSSVSATVWVEPDGSGDGVEMQLVEDPDLDGNATCEAASFATAVWQPLATYATFLLSSGDGPKAVCFRSRDAAGNLTDPTSPTVLARDTIILDTVAPTAPRISTAPVVTTASSQVVGLSVTATDANPFHYELQGGQYAAWTPTAASPPWTFQLGAPADGVYNLGVRAVDAAGNVGGQDFVTIVRDTAAPGLVRHQDATGVYSDFGAGDVDAGDGYVVVAWEPPADGDVAGYYLYYGPVNATSADGFTGSGASEGTSPINVGSPCAAQAKGDDCSFRLTGLPNGTTVYVTVAAYDRTQVPRPNVGALAAVTAAIPNRVVPRLASTLDPAALGVSGGFVRGVALRDGLAYVATGGSAGSGRLAVVDLARPGAPAVLGLSAASMTYAYDVHLVGNFAYVADGSAGLRTFDVSNPAAPTEVGLAGVGSFRADAVAGQGDLVFVAASATPAGTGTAQLLVFTTKPVGACTGATLASPCQLAAWSGPAGVDHAYNDVAAQGSTVYLAGFYPYVRLVDVSNPAAPTLAGTFTSAPGNEWPVGLDVSGRYLYVEVAGGLRVVDVSDPAAPVERARMLSDDLSKTVRVAAGRAYVLSPASLEVVELRAASTAVGLDSAGSLPLYSEPWSGNYLQVPGDLQVEGNYAVVSAGTNGLKVVRLTAARTVEATASFTTGGLPYQSRALTAGNHVVFVDVNRNLRAVHADPFAPTDAASSYVGVQVTELAREGDLLLAAGWDSGHIVGRRLAASGLTSAGEYTPSGTFSAWGMVPRWPYLFTAGCPSSSCGGPGSSFRTVSLRDYSEAASVPYTPVGSSGTARLAGFGRYVYVTNGTSLEIFDVSSPTAPAHLASIPLGVTVVDVALVGTRLVLGSYTGLIVLGLAAPGSPTSPVELGRYTGASFGQRAVLASGDLAYLVGDQIGVLDISDPTAIKVLAAYGYKTQSYGAAVCGDYVFATNALRDTVFIHLR